MTAAMATISIVPSSALAMPPLSSPDGLVKMKLRLNTDQALLMTVNTRIASTATARSVELSRHHASVRCTSKRVAIILASTLVTSPITSRIRAR